MSDRLLKESDVLRIAFQLPYVVNSAFFDIVKALPPADRPQEWIPCSERMPEEDGFYLATITDGEQIAVCKMPFVEAKWRDNLFDDEVLAWMPLPKPWKGADDETD